MFRHLLKPWLLLPVSWAHALSPKFLKYTYNWRPFTNSTRFSWQSLEWKGLKFRNPTGIAGGVDENAENIPAWWNLGVGFVEIGTVTPFAQKANPGVTVGRDLKLKALWNCLGFPNHGYMYVKKRLAKIPARGLRPTPVFVNIGKNRWTKNEEAHEDYCYLMRELYIYADAFVINISSPNTSGLRDLFNADNFKKFLNPIFKTHHELPNPPPLILKLSPDLSEENLKTVIESIKKTPICGLILTNTTQSRTKDMVFPTDRGGVSGEPLKQLSEDVLAKTISLLGEQHRHDFLLISAGGIMSKDDVKKRMQLGADLVQIYSALIFEGPGFFKSLSRSTAE